MDPSLIVAVVAGIIVFIYITIKQSRQSDERQEEMIDYAVSRGYRYLSSHDSGWSASLFTTSTDNNAANRIKSLVRGHYPFTKGANRDIRHIIECPVGSKTFYWLDHSACVQEKGGQRIYRWGVIVLRVPCRFPDLLIRPHESDDKYRKAMGHRAIQFENEAFNRSYLVKSDNDKFAFDILHPKMIEKIMELPTVSIELSGNLLILTRVGWNSGPQIDQAIKDLMQIWDLIPPYVHDDCTFDPVRSARLN